MHVYFKWHRHFRKLNCIPQMLYMEIAFQYGEQLLKCMSKHLQQVELRARVGGKPEVKRTTQGLRCKIRVCPWYSMQLQLRVSAELNLWSLKILACVYNLGVWQLCASPLGVIPRRHSIKIRMPNLCTTYCGLAVSFV